MNCPNYRPHGSSPVARLGLPRPCIPPPPGRRGTREGGGAQPNDNRARSAPYGTRMMRITTEDRT